MVTKATARAKAKEEYYLMVNRMQLINSEASDYMRTQASQLEGFVYSGSLISAFGWWRTPQGPEWWGELCAEEFY